VQASDRSEFEKGLAEIFAAIDKPLGDAQREAFWRGLKQMSLIEFSRCRDKIIDDLREGEIPRKFGVPDIWVTRTKLQAAAPSMPTDDGFRGDHWDEDASMHLRAYLGGQLAGNSQRYGRPASYMGMKTSTSRNADASPEFVRNVQILVRYKNQWAEQMRQSSTDGVPIPEQKEVWAELMSRAESEISRG
jgi:hypothetical protein